MHTSPPCSTSPTRTGERVHREPPGTTPRSSTSPSGYARRATRRICSPFVTRTRTSSPRPSSPASPRIRSPTGTRTISSLFATPVAARSRLPWRRSMRTPRRAAAIPRTSTASTPGRSRSSGVGAASSPRRCEMRSRRERPPPSSSTTDRPGTKGRSRQHSSARSRCRHSRSRMSSVKRLPSRWTPGPSGCACTRASR